MNDTALLDSQHQGKRALAHVLIRPALPLALLLSGLSLTAQSPSVGLSLGVGVPAGLMASSVETGLVAGLQVRWALEGGHALLPRVDVAKLSGGSDGAGAKTDRTLTFVGLDYNHFRSRKTGDGFFLAAGLGYVSIRETYATEYLGGYGSGVWFSSSQSRGSLYVALGAGATLSQHLELAGRALVFRDGRQADPSYNYYSPRPAATDSTSGLLTLALTYHF